jgi:hypothetical protein
VEVDSKDAAAEVAACVRNDGMEMSEIAEESRYPFHSSEVLLEDVPSEQQQKFLSVKAWNALRSDSARRWLRSVASENAHGTISAGRNRSRAARKANYRPLFQ